MDVKLGVRTFQEAEAASKKLRPDLYERLCRLYPLEVSDEEHRTGAVTKHRFMQARDTNSTSRSLGYRIEGVAGTLWNHRRKETQAQLGACRTKADTVGAFDGLAREQAVPADKSRVSQARSYPLRVATAITKDLRELRAAAKASDFVRRHEFIGTSILLVVDARGRTAVRWIDFAKTSAVPAGRQIGHDRQWKLGNHEDGLFTGLDGMIDAWESLVERLTDETRSDEHPRAPLCATGGLPELDEDPSPQVTNASKRAASRVGATRQTSCVARSVISSWAPSSPPEDDDGTSKWVVKGRV